MLVRDTKDIYVGETPIIKVYSGNSIVYEKEETPYTLLKNISASNNQYIDTKFKPNQDTRVLMELDSSGNSATWFGSLSMTSYYPSDWWQNNVYACCNDYINSGGHYFGYGYQSAGLSGTTTGEALIDMNKNIISINGTVVHTFNYEQFQTIANLYLFAQNRNYNGEVYSKGTTVFKCCKIYDNGTLIRDFIPVLDENNTPCLFDKVNKEFYYNKGTGTFGYTTI